MSGRTNPQHSDTTTGEQPRELDLRSAKQTIIAAALFVAALALYLFAKIAPAVPEPVKEFFLALTAAMAVHLLDRLWLHRDTHNMLDRLRRNVVSNVKDETQHLISQLDQHTKQALGDIRTSIHKSIGSLEALNRSGVLDVYSSREVASKDIARDLTLRTNRKVRLIGISLNDFVLRGNDPLLGAAWRTMQECIENGVGPNSQLDLKILIIDPTCCGAQLRSRAEERSPSRSAGRLKHDVDAAIELLLSLRAAAGVTFECRLYRLPPSLFLCWTDSACYVQQYYFWSSRVDNKSFPILKFLNVQDSSGVRSIHEEMEMHFNWIWEKASIGLQAYWREFSRGTDKGIAQAGVTNVFTDPNDGRMRMLHLLSCATKKVSIQGISLHSFFNRHDPKLYQAISGLLFDDNVDIEVLFLDPDCDQAKFRAMREYSFDGVTTERQQYFSEPNGAHRASTLHRETSAAKSILESMVREIASRKPSDWKPRPTAGYYDSAPCAFLLRVDDAILSEQYHYGKLPGDLHGARIILGKDLPLFEYTRTADDLFDESKRMPFGLLSSHLEFAIQQAALFPVEDWAAQAPRKPPGPNKGK